MSRRRPGLVSLVGAGPGDPDHLTLKAARCLRQADLVLYDALVDPEVLALAARADQVFVGKRAGHVQTSQAAIHEVMIAAAQAGQRVVARHPPAAGDPPAGHQRSGRSTRTRRRAASSGACAQSNANIGSRYRSPVASSSATSSASTSRCRA